MSSSRLLLPTDKELRSAAGFSVAARETVRQSPLSIIQRLHLDNAETPTAILKVTVSEMRHEAPVNRFASGLDIGATKVLAADSEATFPWLIQQDIGSAGGLAEPTLEDAGALLESLGEFHAKGSIPTELSAVPDRSLRWMVDNLDEVLSVIHPAVEKLVPRAPEFIADGHFERGLKRLAEIVSRIPLTVVHGDFDPGNIIFTRGRWRAIDWGLSHWNIPFVDLAHMLNHLAKENRSALIRRYFNTASDFGIDMPDDVEPLELANLGNSVHEAFFTWWHSLCISELGVPADTYAATLVKRYDNIRSRSPELQEF